MLVMEKASLWCAAGQEGTGFDRDAASAPRWLESCESTKKSRVLMIGSQAVASFELDTLAAFHRRKSRARHAVYDDDARAAGGESST